MTEHIKMPAVIPVVRYLADGVQSVFIYPFPVFASEDLTVMFDGAVQVFGFSVEGSGQSAGGSVTFAAAPANGVVVPLARELKLERVTDFIEGGDFSARAINNELDYLMASVQQVSRAQGLMLGYSDAENPGVTTLPDRTVRANKALGFDGAGNPVAVSLEGSMAAPDFTAIGTGAVTRTSADKFSDLVSVKDFGAVGDGITDDLLAFQKALTAHDSVFVPSGVYLISGTVSVEERKALIGAGQKSVIKAQADDFAAIELPAGYARVQDLRIEGGAHGILLNGRTGPCVQNNICDVTLDWYNDTNWPCYWNNFARVLVAQPAVHGVHLKKSGAGDTPNANHFHACRVYSLSADISGAGFYVEHGAFSNSFVDCEANVKGTALACFRIGAQASKTLLINPFAESNNGVPNVQLDAGSVETAIFNLTSESDGAAIYDLSGGNYDAVNAGYPNKNRLRKTSVTDLNATLMRYDTEYIDTHGTVNLDVSHSVHLVSVSASSGALNVVLPNAADAVGVTMTVKKIDNTGNIVTITEDGGDGPDRNAIQLGGQYDFGVMLSNGAEWFIVSCNRMAGNTRYFDGSGTYDLDMAVDTYLLSSFGGAMTARLPPANAANAVGRTVTIKKTDGSANHITVTEQGGSGPDQSSQVLSAQYDAVTVVSNGGQWFIVSTYP